MRDALQENRAKVLGRTRNPICNLLWRKKGTCFHFERGGMERTFVDASENFDKLPAILFARREAADWLQVWGFDTELLPKFPAGRFDVGFSAIHMPGGRRVPTAGVSILPNRAFLEV